MKPPTRQNLELTLVDSGATYSVAEFQVSQSLSKPWEVVLLIRAGVELDLEATIGQLGRFQAATSGEGPLALLAPPTPQRFTGYVVAVEDVGGDAAGHRLFRVVIASRLWALSQNRTYRVFQQATEIEIACEIFDEWKIKYTLAIDPSRYRKLKYRVQYAESDLTFVQRNLESVGVTYNIVDIEGEQTVVLSDEPQRAEPRAELTFVDAAPGHGRLNWVKNLSVTRLARPGRYVMQDLDYRRPNQAQRIAVRAESTSGLEQGLERFQYVPGNSLRVVDSASDTPAADDKSVARTDERVGQLISQMRLDAKQASRWQVSFQSNVLDLHPGVVVPIVNHDRPELSGPVLVTRTVLRGTDIGAWRIDCEASLAADPYRPLMRTPIPRAGGVESATVVGPAGTEIHTDEFGRVRVQFHWDRAGSMDDGSSAWLPVSQTIAGPGYGSVHLPRIGHEVLVDFLGGDVDKPMVVGRVYTQLQPVPYKLPENKTITVICRTQTVGGSGYNEIMAEDAAGQQVLGFQAERDLRMLVKRDELVHVRHDMTEIVDNDRTSSVGGNWKFDALPPPPPPPPPGARGPAGPAGAPAPRSGLDWNHNRLDVTIGASKVKATHDTVTLSVGGASSITITAGKISINSPTVEINGSTLVDVHGGTIQLNC
jgi:type VI secretion system secreted protein VgrG